MSKKEEYDGTVYKKEIRDRVAVVDSVVINKKKKKKQENPQILENVPEEFNRKNMKVLLENG